jgi:hypothetical protein
MCVWLITSVAAQSGPERSADAGCCHLPDTRTAVLRGCGHRVEPLHAAQAGQIRAHYCAGIRC